MKPEMIEAARLTKEGRLAEAMALIRRSLGLGAGSVDVSPPSVEVGEAEVDSGSAKELPAPDHPPTAAAPIDEKPPVQPETGRQGNVHPGPPPILPRLDTPFPGGLRMPGMVKPPLHGPLRRGLPPEVIAPPAGQWTV